jgi:RNA polymerase primary sigma factor
MNVKLENNKKKSNSSAGDNVLSMYMRDLDNLPLLSREEEDEIARKAVSGDAEAREKLITANLRFVVSIAKRYQGKGLHLNDLISEGNLGLLAATDRYDPEKGYHFITYAVWWIRQSILKAIYEKSRAIRLPINRISDLIQIERISKDENANLKVESEIKRVSGRLNMPEKDVRMLLRISRTLISLDTPANSENPDSPAIVESLSDECAPGPDETAMRRFMIEDIEDSLDGLNAREASVLRYHYGIGDRAQMSLRELGNVLGITKERARQLEKKALQQLAADKTVSRLKPYCA